MNDQVNKVIAAILNADNIEGGAKRGRRRNSKSMNTHHAGGIMGNIRYNSMHGGEAEESTSNNGLNGGSCGAPHYDRYLNGGESNASEANVVDVTPEPVVPVEAPAADLSGGRSKKRSKRRGSLPPALRKNQEKVMKIYKEMKKRYPNVPGNELMKRAMKAAKRSK